MLDNGPKTIARERHVFAAGAGPGQGPAAQQHYLMLYDLTKTAAVIRKSRGAGRMIREAFSRGKNDAQLREQGWEITNTNAVRIDLAVSNDS